MLVLYKLSATANAQTRKIWADGGYAGHLVDWERETLNSVLEIVEKEPYLKVFRIQPRRWAVGRTCA